MLAKRIIPCLDVKNGRVVKGVQFVGLRDAGDPVECAARYDAEGADEITFLDITASSDERRILLDIVERTAATVRVPLTVGGGVRRPEDVRDLLHAGADKVSINTSAVRDPALVEAVSGAWGAQAIVVAIDARRVSAEGEILLTSMDRDGTRDGYDLALTRAVSDAVTVPVIASGGVGTLGHVLAGLTAGGADAALAASIFHDGEHSVGAVKAYLASHGVRVRPPVGTESR